MESYSLPLQASSETSEVIRCWPRPLRWVQQSSPFLPPSPDTPHSWVSLEPNAWLHSVSSHHICFLGNLTCDSPPSMPWEKSCLTSTNFRMWVENKSPTSLSIQTPWPASLPHRQVWGEVEADSSCWCEKWPNPISFPECHRGLRGTCLSNPNTFARLTPCLGQVSTLGRNLNRNFGDGEHKAVCEQEVVCTSPVVHEPS